MSLENLRKGANAIINGNKKSNTNSGKRGNLWSKWKPPKKPSGSTFQVAEPIVFVDAKYPDYYNIDRTTGQPVEQPFHHFREHNFRKGPTDFRTLICSAGADPYTPQPCNGCYEADHGAKGSDARDQVAFNIGHLVNYHTIPWVKDGQIQYKKDQNGNFTRDAILVDQQCTGRGCAMCQQNAPVRFGAHRTFQMGSGHLGYVLQLVDKVGAFCANCLSNVVVTEFVCPSCTNPILDVATSGLTNEQLSSFGKTEIPCPHCRNSIVPREVIDCGYDPTGMHKLPGKGCPDNVEPRRLSLFDCVFYLQREGESKDTKIVDVAWVPKSQFPTSDNRHVDEHIREIVKQPFDFAAMFAPDELEDQARKLGISNHFSQLNTQQPMYTAYGPASTPSTNPYAVPSRPNYGK